MLYDALGYFSVLGADETTDSQRLKILYRDRAKFWHPDVNKAENAMDMFQKLSKAYDTLKDPKTKILYSLLSLIYTPIDFPNLARLNTYKSAKGFETPYLRVFSISRLEKGQIKTENLIGTYDDALVFIKKATIKNFLSGFLSKKFYKALEHNLNQMLSDNHENLKLLIHNAAAFYDEGKFEASYISAVSALSYANQNEKEAIQKFLKLLGPVQSSSIQTFDTQKLRKMQLQPFIQTALILGMMLIILIGTPFLLSVSSSKEKSDEINYYQTIEVGGGQEITDDLITSKIVKIPVDLSDNNMLYHITKEVPVMYGPSEKFDVLAKALQNQTVRITGHTPDNTWYRVMLDNGDMGFVQTRYLQKGIGLSVPNGSKIILNDR